MLSSPAAKAACPKGLVGERAQIGLPRTPRSDLRARVTRNGRRHGRGDTHRTRILEPFRRRVARGRSRSPRGGAAAVEFAPLSPYSWGARCL
jgi:hypothetical protein